MALRRNFIDSTHPTALTAEQRHAELAALFARGAIRYIEIQHVEADLASENSSDSSRNCLEVVAESCPDGTVVNAPRE